MYNRISNFKFQISNLKNQRGQTLLEVVVVVSVSVIVISGLVFATIASLRNSQFSKNQALATKLAQEGLERVRVGRDRNQCIINLNAAIYGTDRVSWNGYSNNTACIGSGSWTIWDLLITGGGLCDDTNAPQPKDCYFNVDSSGQLTNIGYASPDIPVLAEGIPPGAPVFRRVITLSDGGSLNPKKITAIVRWTDVSGTHESKLTTILRKISL